MYNDLQDTHKLDEQMLTNLENFFLVLETIFSQENQK